MRKLLGFVFGFFDYGYFYKKKYLVNKRSSEVHRLDTIKPMCTRNISKENILIMSQYDLNKYSETHPLVNGCYHCYREFDTDKKYR